MKKQIDSICPIDRNTFRRNIDSLEGITKLQVNIKNRVWADEKEKYWMKDTLAPQILPLKTSISKEDKIKFQKLIKKALVNQGIIFTNGKAPQIEEARDAILKADPVYQGQKSTLKTIQNIILPYLQQKPLYILWLTNITGKGVILAGKLINEVDSRTFPSRSHLTKRFGYYCDDNGKAARRVKGQTFICNPKGKL